jgi:hypothetical protein
VPASGAGWLGITAVLIGLAVAGLVAMLALGTSDDGDTEDGASGPHAAMAGAAPVVPVSSMPQRVAGPLSLSSLAMRFRALPMGSGRGELRFVRDGAGYSVITLPGVSPSTVRTLAARLGGEPVPFTAPLDGVLTPELVRTSVSLNVRRTARPDGPLVRTLPRGSIVVGFTGRFDGVDSRRAGSGSWMWVAVTETDAGFSAARFLDQDAGCVPELSSVLEPLDERRRAALSNDVVVGRVPMWRDDQRFDGVWAVARDPEEHRSHVLVFREGNGCALDLTWRQTVNGFVVDTLFTETTEEGGDTLLVVAWRESLAPDPRGEETWTAFRVGHEASVFEATLQSSQQLPRGRRATLGTRVTNGPDGAAGYFPLRIRYADGRREVLAWTEDRLEALAAPTPTEGSEPTSATTDGAESRDGESDGAGE